MKTSKLTVHKGKWMACLNVLKCKRTPDAIGSSVKSQKLHNAIAQNIAYYRAQNGLSTNAPVPADAVTASGSGLDSQISVRNAELQSPHVAKARTVGVEKVLKLVLQNTEGRDLGVLGEPRVNVFTMNLALDQMDTKAE